MTFLPTRTLPAKRTEILLLTDLLTQTLDVADAKAAAGYTIFRLSHRGPPLPQTFARLAADMPHRELARHFSGGLTCGESHIHKNMVVDTHDINDFIVNHYRITYLPVTRPAGYITASQLTPWRATCAPT